MPKPINFNQNIFYKKLTPEVINSPQVYQRTQTKPKSHRVESSNKPIKTSFWHNWGRYIVVGAILATAIVHAKKISNLFKFNQVLQK